MVDSKRRKLGEEKIAEVYAGALPLPPEGQNDFADIMLSQLFAEVWTRDVLSMRDRRLLLLGAILAQGESMTFGIQSKTDDGKSLIPKSLEFLLPHGQIVAAESPARPTVEDVLLAQKR